MKNKFLVMILIYVVWNIYMNITERITIENVRYFLPIEYMSMAIWLGLLGLIQNKKKYIYIYIDWKISWKKRAHHK